MPQRKITPKGLHKLYADNPLEADRLLWGRESDPLTRRGFLKKSGLLAMSTILGAAIPFWRHMPAGLIPAVLADSTQSFKIPGKHPGLIILNDRPLNAETPAHLLDDYITPTDKLFVRNNGIPPQGIDPDTWALTITGESAKKTVTYTLKELKQRFKNHTYQLTIECAGNGRYEFNPPVAGNQWTVGAVGSPEWTGVRLGEVLNAVGIKEDAVYIGYYGKDTHISGAAQVPISRGVPIAKALEPHSLIAWAVNGADLPLLNGYPLRLVCPGWPASTSGKWLEKIVIRNRVHDGPKMGGYSYRLPCTPVAPGAKVPDEEMCIIEAMPVKSLITYPRSGAMLKLGQPLYLRGHAWAGELAVSAMAISIDFGATWQRCSLKRPKNRYAWQHWSTRIHFPQRGYYEIWARATDEEGTMQPMIVPGWNPKGYLNNACHRIAVKIL
jgi:sulfite oxidase